MNTRVAQCWEMDEVHKLTYEMYLQRGYIKSNPSGMLKHYPRLDDISETTVFVTEDAGRIVGTNSLTVDGVEKLHVDHDFPNEVEQIRKQCKMEGKTLGASWRIITSTELRSSLGVILSLITATMECIGWEKLDCLLFSFHPRHRRVYSRLLGLDVVASGSCGSVAAGVPGVLMRGDSQKMARRWKALCYKRHIPFQWMYER